MFFHPWIRSKSLSTFTAFGLLFILWLGFNHFYHYNANLFTNLGANTSEIPIYDRACFSPSDTSIGRRLK